MAHGRLIPFGGKVGYTTWQLVFGRGGVVVLWRKGSGVGVACGRGGGDDDVLFCRFIAGVGVMGEGKGLGFDWCGEV